MKFRYIKISFIFILCVFLLCGCQKKSSNKETESKQENVLVQAPQESKDIEGDVPKEKVNLSEEIEDGPQPGQIISVEVPIYTIDTETMDSTKATVAFVPEGTDLTATLIAQLVINDLADKSYLVEVNNVTMKDNYAVIDFDSSTPPIVNVGKEVEETILDAFAFSILDNVSDCEGVIFRSDGKEYQSENNEFEINHVYLYRNK